MRRFNLSPPVNPGPLINLGLLAIFALLTACSTPDTLGPGDTRPAGGAADSGQRVQSGAVRAWSGGLKAWSGGLKAWSGGSGALEATGAVLEENRAVWEKLSLAVAHQVLAPELGRGVVVAVIDTGIDPAHPIFSGRLVANRFWHDFVAGDSDPGEVPGAAFGHGTVVASLVLQVAPAAKLMPLRVLGGDGSGNPEDVAAAVDWAVARGADVVQLSLGTEAPAATIEAAVERATARGVYVVASAGNSNGNPTYPAYTVMLANPTGDMGVGVGSVSLQDVKSPFSNFAPEDGPAADGLEMVAFGEAVYGAVPGNKIAAWDGTSVAAPLVTGALALALGNGAEALSPRTLALEVVRSGLELDAEGTVGGVPYELEQRLEVGLFLCSALNLNVPQCQGAFAEADDDDGDDGDGSDDGDGGDDGDDGD